MIPAVRDIWVYLATSPLLWLTATQLAYLGAHWLFRRCGENPLLNPVALAVLALLAVLAVTGTDYPTCFDGAQIARFETKETRLTEISEERNGACRAHDIAAQLKPERSRAVEFLKCRVD